MSQKASCEQLEKRIHELEQIESERDKVLEALRESEDRLNLVIKGSNDAPWDWDLVSNNLYYSPQWWSQLGYAPGELSADDTLWERLMHPEDGGHVQSVFGDALKSETLSYEVEFRLLHKDGHYVPVLSRGFITRDDTGKPIRVTGMNMDLSEQKKIENILKDNEQRYKSAQRMGLVGNWEYDLVTERFWGSGETKRIFGYDPKDETFSINKIENCIPERERVHQALVDLIEKEKSYDLEFEIRPFTGAEKRVIHSTAELVKNASGLTIKVIGVIQDITNRKQAENKTALNTKRLEEAQRIAQVGDWDWDPITDTIAWSEQLYRIFSLDPNEPPPQYQGQLKLYHPEDAILLNEVISKSLKDCTPYELELRRTNPDGHVIYLLTRGETETDQFGKITRLFGSVQDITARKINEKRLQESEERYKELFENAPFPYQSLDKNGCILEVNRRWLEHLGYSRDEVAGKFFGEFLHPDWQDHFKENFPTFKSVGEVLGIEFQLRKKDETYIWVSFDGKIRRDEAGIFLQTHCIFTDISKEKRLQDRVDQQREALGQSRKLESVGRLAGGIAHDFNNMLSIILGYTEMALEKLEPNDPLYVDMTEIHQAGKRSADITRQLLAFARKQTVAPKVLNLNTNIGSMIKMLRHLIGEDIDFSWMPGTELWSVKIDPSQIDQILANLCVNARAAITDVGKVTIETKNIAFDEEYCADHAEFLPGEYVMIAVSDDGCGIAPEIMGQIFEPFFTTKGIGEGTGLGLATVYGIVKQNKGFINVYSELNKGTTLRIYLSRYVEHVVEERNEPSQEIPLSRGETILLVEDDPSILKLGIRIIEKMGYKVLSTTKPKEAQKIAEEYDGQINLLITDVVMPEMNGRELSEQLRHLYPQLKILFMSGYTANVIAHRGVLDEGINFISKPFSPKGIAVKIREALA